MALTDIPGMITYDQQLAPGMAIVAVWPNYTLLPLQSKLDAVAAKYGDPFQLSYWGAQHVGIELTKEVVALEVYQAFAKVAAGNAPVLIAMPADSDTAVGAEVKKKQLEEAAAIGLEAMQDGTIAGAKLPATGASWLNYVPYILLGAGVLFVGYKAFGFFSARKQRGKR